MIFEHVRASSPAAPTVPLKALVALAAEAAPAAARAALAEVAARHFAPNGVHAVSEADCVNAVQALYEERKNLALALRDIDSVLVALRRFFGFLSFFLLLFVALIVFSTGSFAEVTVTTGTTFLAFSFLFGDTAKSMFSAFVFVFVRSVLGFVVLVSFACHPG